MNLYLFNDNDSAAVYGIGTYLKELTHAVKGSYIHVRIVHLHADRPKFEIEETDDVENWYIPEVRNQRTFDGPVNKIEDYFKSVIYLLKLYIMDTADLVFHFNFNLCQTLSKGLKEVFDCKTVATINFMKWGFELQGNLFRFHALKSKPEEHRTVHEQILYATDEYEGLLYKVVDKVIALTPNMKELLCSEYLLDVKKISVIPYGMKDINPVPGDTVEILQNKWHLSKKDSLIFFAGRLHPVKGLLFLIRAFRKVLDKIPDCRLIIAGSGLYEPFISEAKDICTKVSFAGLLEKEALYELYQIADVGVMPSLYESFGLVAAEMMMHGLPIVVTASLGLNEVVDESCGIKIPITEHPDRVEIDTELLAEKIIYLLRHPVEAKQMGQNGRKRYLEKYSLPVFRKNMLDFYHDISK